MTNYRIIKIDNQGDISFKVQRKFLWFWVNAQIMEEQYCTITITYETLAQAKKQIKKLEHGYSETVINY